MASGSGQAEAAGPHLPSALGPLTPNAARATASDNYTVGKDTAAEDVGDITMRAVESKGHADKSELYSFTMLMTSVLMQPPFFAITVSW